MNNDLSQIIAGLFARQMERKELLSQIQILGDEVRKAFQSEGTLYGKYCGLLESFRTIIPDEKQRYQAALQALSTTSKLNRQEIITAINGQLGELKILEKGLMPSLPVWRDGLKAMEARVQELRGETAKLRERIAQLESEERAVLAGMTERDRDVDLAEKTIRELFATIGAEIAALHKKVEDLTAEGPASQPAPPAPPPVTPAELPKSAAPAAVKGGGEKAAEIKGPSAPQDSRFQRKCPMCGGPFNLLELSNIWQCYTCAYEEPNKG